MTTDGTEELERLRQQLHEITIERDRLLIENCRLRRNSSKISPALGQACLPFIEANVVLSTNAALSTRPATITKESPLAERINLFRSLFRGREDVFAKMWWSSKNQKIGYSPVCRHEWNPALCGKPKTKCADCPNQDLVPLTNELIRGHLEGRHTLGIYPMLSDQTCHFLAIDFDKQSWKEDATAFLETCRQLAVPAAIERSRSGNGAHVWIFFTVAVPATAARKLGCYLLTETMSHHYRLRMESYDRLFPNQDTLPKGGFGNLIALPLQKEPVDSGNTLFLNETIQPYDDQWAFLFSIKRLDPSTLTEMVNEATQTGQIIGVPTVPTDEEERPWEIPPSKRLPRRTLAGPLPPKIKIVMGNLLFVEKKGLPSPLLIQIKRLAAFQNPEFYKKQNMRLSTALTARVICCAEEFPEYLGIPRGCLGEIQGLLENIGIKIDVIDERFLGSEIDVRFHGILTSTQLAAVSALKSHDDGVLVAPSGSGKTVVGINMIATRRTNTLILVHRHPLLEQWRTQLANFLEVDSQIIGQIGGGKDKRTGIIDVAMLQSLIKKGEVADLVAGYGQIIIDECHHLPAVTFEQVLRQVKARYILGLTATPYRRDGLQSIIQMQCGPIRHIVSQKDQRTQGSLHHLLICRDTGFVGPAQELKPSINDIYATLIEDEPRNQMIIDDLMQALEEGRSPILLTERREHLEFFAGKLTGIVRNVVVLRGGMGTKQRRAVTEQLASIPTDEKRVLLATGRYIGEGFDDAQLDTLFLAMPVSWKGTLVQYAGRIHRLYAGKTEARIYDYVDRNNPMLLRMFQKRLRGYHAMGYE